MARTIEQIATSITERLKASFNLSTSSAAEWRLWVHCVAYAIHLFEIVLDVFKREMEEEAQRLVVGTLTWYNNKCYEFQNGHELVFNEVTGLLEYEVDDEKAQVVKIAAVNVENGLLYFRVGTIDKDGNVVPITDTQMVNFKNYIDAIKFAGTKSSVISTSADQIHYALRVYYNPAVPVEMVRSNILGSLAEFKVSQKFGGVIYRHRMMEAVTTSEGVITAKLLEFSQKSTEDAAFRDIDILSYLYAGYFDYTDDSSIELISINDI